MGVGPDVKNNRRLCMIVSQDLWSSDLVTEYLFLCLAPSKEKPTNLLAHLSLFCEGGCRHESYSPTY